MKIDIKISFMVIIPFFLICTYIYIDNNNVKVRTFNIYADKLPHNFNGFKIMLLADFHNADYYRQTAEKIIQSKPNITVIAGDLVNMGEESFQNSLKLIEMALPVAPIYFSSGNHEQWSENHSEILDTLKQKGVKILNNESTHISYRNSKIALIGFEDTVYSDDKMRIETVEKTLNDLSSIPENKGLFNILIFHRANLYNTVAKYPFDLVLSGHLHGGQIGIPFIGDYILYNVNKDNKYIKGYYRKENSQIIVSGGLSNSLKNPRIFNPPELVLVTLKSIQ